MNELVPEILEFRLRSPVVSERLAKQFLKRIVEEYELLAITVTLYHKSQMLEYGELEGDTIHQTRISIKVRDIEVGEATLFYSNKIDEAVETGARSFFAAFALNWYHTWILDVLQVMSRQLSFDGKKVSFNCALADLICEAYGSSHVVIRERNTDSFECVGYSGIDRNKSLLGHQLTPDDDLHGLIEQVIAQSLPTSGMSKPTIITPAENGKLFPQVAELVGDPATKAAVVLPMVFGGEIEGIVSLIFDDVKAAKLIDHDVLFLTTNLIAGASRYFNSANKLATKKTNDVIAFRDRLNFEIIQGLRHSSNNNLQSAKVMHRVLGDVLPKKGHAKIPEYYGLLGDDLNLIGEDLKSMETIVSSIGDDYSAFELSNLSEKFNNAAHILKNRLNPNSGKRIRINNQLKDCWCLCNGNLIRYAFMNLIINSTQAIQSNKKSPNPGTISIIGREHGDVFQFDISDTGGGVIIPSKYFEKIEDIWEGGRSSKEGKGTGFGLAMVRDVFQDVHQGTIRVLEYSPNLTLRLDLPKFPAGMKDEYTSKMRDKGLA